MSFLVLALETALAPVAALGVVLSFLLSPKRGRLRGLAEELPERFGGLSAEARRALAGRRVWWLHAASAGEVAGLAPVLVALAARPDAPAVILTTTTRAGREAAKGLPGVAWAQLAPLDAWPCVARFLSAAAPERLVLAETELWPSTLILAARAGLKPVLVNARLTERSRGRYAAVRPLLAPALAALAAVGAQDEPDLEAFASLGVPRARLSVSGNCKYDRAPALADLAPARARLAALGWEGKPVFVAGSTHPVEEDAVLAAFLQAKARVPDLRLVLAPRHSERAADALRSLRDAALKIAVWSKPASGDAGAEALLVDAMGVLPALYPSARAAFVGGTMVPVGGHNLLEPALAGAPVLYGPHTGHIEWPARLLENGGGGLRVHDAIELGDRLAELGADAGRAAGIGGKARALASRLRGATTRTVAVIDGPVAA